MEDRYIAAVDLGTFRTTLTVAQVTGNNIQIIWKRHKPSEGMRYSAILNPIKASGPVKDLIEEASKELKISILQVVVGLPRCDISQKTCPATVERTNPEDCITEEEVEVLKSIAQEDCPMDDPEHQTLYGAVAQSFDCDDETQLIESDIVGMISGRFTGNFKLFTGKKSNVKNIDKLFNTLGIAIAKKYFTPDSISTATLTDEEMENGVALIDFGAGVTSVTIYKGRILRYYGAIKFGGKVITDDIRKECSISGKLAENIKLGFGACMPDKLGTLSEKILQIEGDETAIRQIPVKFISEIITARATEIIEAICWHIQKSGYAGGLRSGVVITGGGAELLNIGGLIKEISGYEVRKGYPRNKFSGHGIAGLHETWATNSLGMVISAVADNVMSCVDAAPEIEEVAVEPVESVIVEEPVEVFEPEMTKVTEEAAKVEEAAEPEEKVEQKEPEVKKDSEEKKEAQNPKKTDTKKKNMFAKFFTNVMWKKVENAADEFLKITYDE